MKKIVKKRRRPRVPLPRQQGGAHADKTKPPCRERKHQKKERAQDEKTEITHGYMVRTTATSRTKYKLLDGRSRLSPFRECRREHVHNGHLRFL